MSTTNTIIALTDYKGQFGSKENSKFYRSGMDINLLGRYFSWHGFEMKVLNFRDVTIRDFDWKGIPVIYTSQEDPGYSYKRYIEDVIYALELAGAVTIPSFRFLKGNNNKVFMELLRDISAFPEIQKITTNHFGTLEDFKSFLDEKSDGVGVLKTPEGATSRGVFLCRNKEEALKKANKVSKIPLNYEEYKDMIRPLIHRGYIVNSRNRKKFIFQNFIPNLTNDWKILVFGDKYFIEYRGVRDNDFRASGSHKFFFDDEIFDKIPPGIFNYAEKIRDKLNCPHLSLDIASIDNEFYLFEFQALYFSHYAQLNSQTYFTRCGEEFQRKSGSFELESLYVESVVDFLKSF